VKEKIGAAVIGFGGMGTWHMKLMALDLDDKFEALGVYDICPDRMEVADDSGLIAYESREALLSDPRVELVVVATPNDVHKEIVIDALRHGKNVICEKPVTMSVADFEEMAAVANECGKFFTVHQNRRWDPDYLTAKEIFDSNTLGRVYNIESRVHGSRGIPGDWRNTKEHGGGMLYDWGIHMLDQMLQMMGERRLLSLYCQLTYVTNEHVDDGFRVICQFEDDINYIVEILTSNFVSLPRWYINGENGTAVIRDWDINGEIVKVSDWENRDSEPIVAGMGITKTMAPRNDETIKSYPLPEFGRDETAYYRNIYDVLRNGAAPHVTHEQQRRLLKLVEAMFESGARNAVVGME